MASGHKPKLAFFNTAVKRRRWFSDASPVKVICRDGVMLESPEVNAYTQQDQFAAALREASPQSETTIWPFLEPMGFKHSFPILSYVADFYHPVLKICIEIDGKQHKARRAYDLRRERQMKQIGIKTYRFRAARARYDTAGVALQIAHIVEINSPL